VTPAAPPRQSGGLQQEDSFSSQRSHGLSLRKGNRQQPSSVPPAAAAASKPHQQQQQPQVASYSRTIIRSNADVTLASAGHGQQVQGSAQRRHAGDATPVRVGSSATGTVSAVAAVKAALAGFGTRGWQQQVRSSRHIYNNAPHPANLQHASWRSSISSVFERLLH
jgi:hypothetical protein